MSARGALVEAREHEGALAPPTSWHRPEEGSKAVFVLPLGRFAAVWIPAGIFLFGSGSEPAADRIAALLLVTSVMFACLQRSFAVTHVALGPGVAALWGALAGLLVTSALAFWLPVLRLGSLALVETALGICLLLPPIERLLRKNVLGLKRVLVVGPADSAGYLRQELARLKRSPFEVVGVVGEPLPSDQEVAEAMDAWRPDVVVFAPKVWAAESGEAVVGVAPGDDFEVVGLTEFFDRALGRVPPRQLTSTWFISLLRRRGRRFSKRTFDIVVALVGLLVTAPLWPVLALGAHKARGSVLFRQLRVGEGGKLFTMYKLRTMRVDAEPLGQAVWAEASDPRATFAGRLLREARLDELPQLWNVLKGDMSIVGPRPERPELTPMLEEAVPHWQRRLLVKPGITGWAQIRQGYTADCGDSEEKLSYDLWYIGHRTLLLDAAICLRTLPTLLLRSGAR